MERPFTLKERPLLSGGDKGQAERFTSPSLAWGLLSSALVALGSMTCSWNK